MPTCYRHPGRESYIRCQRCDRPICPDCMRDAAVGFQCPTCVVEGARTTRQGRLAYGGVRSGNPALTSIALVVVNVGVWLAILATGGGTSRLVDVLALRPNGVCLLPRGGFDIPKAACTGTWLPGAVDGAWWQVLTSVFAHVEIWHIAGNMLALWFLGPQLELVLGRLRFLALYLLSGLAGSALVLWASSEYQSTLGASGALFGVFGALFVVALKVGGNLSQIGGLLLINLFITFTVPHISWQGHVGGFVGGAAIAAVLVYAPQRRRGLWQAVGLGAVAVVILAAIIARLALLA